MGHDRVWQCSRCGAHRYGQTLELPSGWSWRMIYSSLADQAFVPVRFDARCCKCTDLSPARAPIGVHRVLPWERGS